MVSPALVVCLVIVASFLVCRLLAPFVIKRAPPALQITNYRGARVPAIGGWILACSVVIGLSLFYFPAAGLAPANRLRGNSYGVAVVALGLFFLGSLDDFSEAKLAKGFRGHLKALAQGRITGGIVKAAGGLGLGLSVGLWWEDSLPIAMVDGLLIALAANLSNLLDLRPGRACKVFLVAWLPLAAVSMPSSYLYVSAPVIGGALAWLPFDLKERATLGDSGSNLLGAILGAGVALQSPLRVKLFVLALLFALNVLSEKVSFTEAISRIPPLRWFDNLGRIREVAPKD